MLYTEMVVSHTILNNLENLDKFLKIDPVEKPISLQLGGNDPEDLAKCAEIAEKYGYDEININCGCPSSRVAGHEFGASLMLKPTLVRDIYCRIKSRVNIPVTIKCRLGCDGQDDYKYVKQFVESIPECEHFIIHARTCILKGFMLTPAQNRCIPPLQPNHVYKLVSEFPDKLFTLNGGIKDVQEASEILNSNPNLFGVMIGRGACRDMSMLGEADELIYKNVEAVRTRRKVIEEYIEYCHRNKDLFPHSFLIKPLASLISDCLNAKTFRTAIMQADKKAKDRIDDFYEISKRASSVLPANFLDSPIFQSQPAIIL